MTSSQSLLIGQDTRMWRTCVIWSGTHVTKPLQELKESLMNVWTSVCFTHDPPAAVYSSSNNKRTAAKEKKKVCANTCTRVNCGFRHDRVSILSPISHATRAIRSKMAKDSSLDFSLHLNKKSKKFKIPLAMGANPGRHSIICPTVLKVAVMILSHTSYLLSREYIEYTVYISRKGRKTRDSGFDFGVAFSYSSIDHIIPFSHLILPHPPFFGR